MLSKILKPDYFDEKVTMYEEVRSRSLQSNGQVFPRPR
jgi:hypothetical protein